MLSTRATPSRTSIPFLRTALRPEPQPPPFRPPPQPSMAATTAMPAMMPFLITMPITARLPSPHPPLPWEGISSAPHRSPLRHTYSAPQCPMRRRCRRRPRLWVGALAYRAARHNSTMAAAVAWEATGSVVASPATISRPRREWPHLHPQHPHRHQQQRSAPRRRL